MNVAIIPARGGSTRIPRKNIRDFLGRPMLHYAIEAARTSGIFEQIWVSTEDPQIARLAWELGARVHPRSAYLADDHIGTQDVMKNALEELWSTAHLRPERACCIYPCVPTLWPSDLQAARDMLTQERQYVIVPGMFYYGWTRAFLEDFPLDHPQVAEFEPNERWIDINTLEDWEKAEQIYRRYKQ